jgi:histidyl-tRNA synthetase
MIKAPRGMKDILPPSSESYLHILDIAAKAAERYGYGYIETPIVEESALFLRSVGESSDIVGKEMYRFTDKGGNDISLRPEGTAGVVRAFIEHKLDRQGGVHRFYYYGPMFRYERPQKGRLREFHQFGVESFGEGSAYEDAAVILLARDILDALGIEAKLKINSLGCPNCIAPYRQKLVEFLQKHDDICDDCRRRRDTNPIRALDCKNSACQKIYTDAPKITDHLCEECAAEFETLKRLLDDAGVAYEVDKNLVRGLDYYTRTAFEFTSDALGAQSAVAGGGRYDGLVEQLGGRPTPAVGFGMGIERLMELMEAPKKERGGYYIGALESEALPKSFALAQSIRRRQKAHFTPQAKSLKAHLKAADKAGARYALIIGADELAKGEVWRKDLTEGSEDRIPYNEALELG